MALLGGDNENSIAAAPLMDDAASWLCDEPIAAVHHRASVWMAEISGGDEESKAARTGKSELVISVRGSGIQSVANPATNAGERIVRNAGRAGCAASRRFESQQSIAKRLDP
jgi:hypothetical protein